MSLCGEISSRYFPNDRLCEWMAETKGVDPIRFDIGDQYVQLPKPTNPEVQKEKPDGKVSPAELRAVLSHWVQEEWTRFMEQDKPSPQPIAKHVYQNYPRLYPAWLPKPWALMSREEREKWDAFLTAVRNGGKPDAIMAEAGVTFVVGRAVKEDDFMGILMAGQARCVGMLNLSRFAEEIVLKRPAQFLEAFLNQKGIQIAHVRLRLAEENFDFGVKGFEVSSEIILTPSAQMAYSLMNSAIAGAIDMETAYREAYEWAPNNFRVLLNLGDYLFRNGFQEEGVGYLRRSARLYPDYDPLLLWQDQL